MLDLEAITLRHLTEDKMEGKTFHEGHIVIDLFNCVREVERLRVERDILLGSFGGEHRRDGAE